MGLLDDLKREADLARKEKEAEAAQQAELDKIYRTEIAPRLSLIHRYLAEMLRHLQDAKRSVNVAFEFPVLGRIDNLIQSKYCLRIDGHGAPNRVSLNCECCLPEERRFKVPIDKAEELRQFLISHRVVFTEWPLRGGFGLINLLLFQAQLRVWAGLTFEADIASSRIRVASYNFEGLAVRDYLFGFERIDNAWLDELGHYLLREKSILGYQEIPEEARARLRRLAAEDKARLSREAESAAVIAREIKSGEQGFLTALRSRLFKPADRE